MKVEYDNDADALYVTLHDGLVRRSEQVDAGTVVDLDEHGQVLAVEVIGPDRAWLTDELESRMTAADVAALGALKDARWGWSHDIELSGV